MEEDVYALQAEFYDLFYDSLEDINLYISIATKHGSPVLECMCGTGRIIIPFAGRGFDIFGVDTSRPMLEKAREKIGKLDKDVRERIHLVKGDVRTFSVDKKFNTIIVPFNSFYHLITEEDQSMMLRSLRRLLTDDGVLVIDIYYPLIEQYPPHTVRHDHTVKDEQGRTVSRFSSKVYHHEEQTQDIHFFFEIMEKDGTLKKFVVPFKLKYLYPDQMKELLEKNGLRVITVYGNYEGKVFEDGDGKMIFVAGKR